MFQTASYSRHPVMSVLAGDEMHVWSQVSLILNRAWFYSTYEVHTPDSSMIDTILLSSINQVIELLQKNGSEITVRQLMLVSPNYLNHTKSWQMEPLSEIWECQIGTEQCISYTYVLADGRHYSDFVDVEESAEITSKVRVASFKR